MSISETELPLAARSSHKYLWATIFFLIGCSVITIAVTVKMPLALQESGKALGGALIVFAVFNVLMTEMMNFINRRMAGWTPESEKLWRDLREANIKYGAMVQEMQDTVAGSIQQNIWDMVHRIDERCDKLDKRIDEMSDDMKERMLFLEYYLTKNDYKHEFDSLWMRHAAATRGELAIRKVEDKVKRVENQASKTDEHPEEDHNHGND